MDRLEAMSMLLKAVEMGSLSAAGRALNIPLPTVSRKISDLEAHLRTRLLIRSSRRISLTDAGSLYVLAAKRILEEVDQAERTASGEYKAPKGDLAVTAPIVFGRLHVLPVVTEFLKAYPEINVRLTLADHYVDLIEDHVDVAVRIGQLADSSLMAVRLGAVRLMVCASPGFVASHGIPQAPSCLEALPCVTFQRPGPSPSWTFMVDGTQISVPIRSRLAVNTAEAAVDACVAGVGLTRILSYQAAKALQEGVLIRVLEAFEPAPRAVTLLHDGQGLVSLKLRAFLDFAASRLKLALASLA